MTLRLPQRFVTLARIAATAESLGQNAAGRLETGAASLVRTADPKGAAASFV